MTCSLDVEMMAKFAERREAERRACEAALSRWELLRDLSWLLLLLQATPLLLPSLAIRRGSLPRPLGPHHQATGRSRWELLRDLYWLLLLLRATPLLLPSTALRRESLPKPLGTHHQAMGRSPLSYSRKGVHEGAEVEPPWKRTLQVPW